VKRIMVVTNSLSGGGAERSMNLICNELFRRNWAVSLVPINSSPPDKVIPKCEIFELGREWQGGIVETTLALGAFNRIVKSWKPDVIILNCDLPELFGALLIGKHNLVVIEHASNPWGQRVVLGKVVRRILDARKTHWAAVSSHLTIWPDRRKPIVFLCNPIIAKSSRSLQSQIQALRRLVFIGRLSSEKRPADAIEIAEKSKQKLVIIGEGLLRMELERKVRREGLNVDFLGRLDEPWAEIGVGDLLIIPSEFEGDGLVVIEALQLGLPILVSDINDFRRFGFSESNYCKEVDDFVQRIQIFSHDLTPLIVSSEVSEAILKPRSIEIVGETWDLFLSEITTPA
jgi:glycosyltransferase involved in cell wall biosynthesis